jgi:hypothetical protein
MKHVAHLSIETIQREPLDLFPHLFLIFCGAVLNLCFVAGRFSFEDYSRDHLSAGIW